MMDSRMRSEEMCLCQLFLQSESVYSIVARFGEYGIAQFRDLNPTLNAFQRKYVMNVRGCEEMERKLRFIEAEVRKENIEIPVSDEQATALQQREIIELEATLDKVESEISEVNANMKGLKKSNMELVEMSLLLRATDQLFEEGMARSQFETESIDEEDGHRKYSLRMADGGQKANCVFGVIGRDQARGVERMLWRVSRGNIYFRYVDIGDVEDPGKGENVKKCAYLMFCPATQLEAKIKKICDAFHATLYPCPEDSKVRQKMSVDIDGRLQEYETVLQQSQAHRVRLLTAASKHLTGWMRNIRKAKAVFHTLNMFNLDVTRKCLIAECWIPTDDMVVAKRALVQGTADSGGTVASIINRLDTDEVPPTYNRSNKFLNGFQNIVDAYGVAKYREMNPAPFTVITFPFLFAVMFGDVGHGIIMTAFAAFLVLRETQLEAAKIRNEIFHTFFGGRYIILLMGLFAVYTGSIYNDIFSKSFNVFGSTWRVPYDNDTLSTVDKLTIDPNSIAFLGYPYPYGFDPIWVMSKNKLNFQNSFKMKMSVILGILHMILGVFLSLLNYKYFRSPVDIVCQFIPQLLFLSCIFLYLCCTILHKWIVFPAGPKQVAVGYYPGSHCAPSLLMGLINMFMLKNRPEGFKESNCATNAYYPNQVTVETILLLIALLCVPWMLLTKPLILKFQHGKATRRTVSVETQPEPATNHAHSSDIPMTVLDNHHTDERKDHGRIEKNHNGVEEFNFAELFIHQAIHTIEYCLGCISHTASYLRLWALSLAHAELSEVLWNMVMKTGFATDSYIGVPVLYGIFFSFGSLTVAILIVMEGLSAFLHALRLHWVEFQSKFFAGTGYLFEPFSFERILDEAEMDTA